MSKIHPELQAYYDRLHRWLQTSKSKSAKRLRNIPGIKTFLLRKAIRRMNRPTQGDRNDRNQKKNT
jgi:hypothetical protein